MKRYLACVLLVAGCNQIDKDKAEATIRDGLKEKKLVLKSVDCPSGQKIEKGAKFSCNVETDTQKLVVDVEQLDAEGTVKWQLRGLVLDHKVFGDALEKDVGGGIALDCGDKSDVINKGTVFSCASKHPDGK